ncbi:toxin [Treponema parvum]|uniref:Toxin n=1 Tax=Treponema parvum TaxID=138851 RepID=A0A975ICM2_9SPIR|nr:toxin [Treponema parvum]QTQ11234.1 toxin [Treponema parvum]QTQ14590.1 toxin [Treponema parvum]QTQ16833.1 toxin [Treponema parvum]
MIFDWNNEKNMMLKRNRNISFEQIIVAIEQDGLLDILENPNKEKYANQLLLLVKIDRYVYVVPCVLENNICFLKTIFPSRKYTAKYLDWEGEENE